MSSYIGVRCPVCNKKFTEADDIVVCPVCGAPHHRDCYAEKNQCVFVADHLSGKEWTNPMEQVTTPQNPEMKTCTRCGAQNGGDSIFCQICGNPMTPRPGEQQQAPYQRQYNFPGGIQMQVDTISMAYGGLDPEDTIDGETVKDLAQYVGNGSAYYLPRFQIIEETGRSLFPNLGAFIFNFMYFFYRKMYLIGSILLGLYIISSIPSYLYTWELLPKMLFEFGLGPDVEINQLAVDHFFWLSRITQGINFFIGLIFSLCANRFYYSKVTTAVSAIRTEATSKTPPAEYSGTLARSGGTSKTAVLIVGATMLTAIFILSTVMSIMINT